MQAKNKNAHKKNTHYINKFPYFVVLFLQIIIAFLGCFSIFIWIGYKWVYRHFGQLVNIDQIVWTLSYNIDGADTKLISSIQKNIVIASVLSLSWVILIFSFNHISTLKSILNKPICTIVNIAKYIAKIKNWKHYNCFYISSGLLFFLFVSLISLYNVARLINNRYDIVSYYENQQLSNKYDHIRELYSVPSIAEVKFNEKKNLVLVMGESLESNFNFIVPLTPNLDKLETKGASVGKLVNNYGSSWTIGALTGWHFGLPLKLPINDIDHNGYHSPNGFLPNALSIFDILKANGYRMVLMMGSNRNFSGMDSLFSQHGNFEILDSSYWMTNGWDINKFKGTDWGYSDAFLFDRAREKLKKLQNKGEPFVLLIETIDTHFVNGYCPKDKRIYNDIRDAYLESDRQISRFADYVFQNKKSPLVMGIIGDHFFMGEPDIFKNVKRNIRNIFLGDIPAIPQEKQNKLNGAVDMAPSILQAAGASWKSSKFGLGTSIFSKEDSLVQKLGLKTYDKYVAMPSKLYQSFY